MQFSPGPEFDPPGTKLGCNRSVTLLPDRLTLNPDVYSPGALATAIGAVFTPAALCVPLEPNKNPPYLCVRKERQPPLTILLQAASMYSTSIGVLVGATLLLLLFVSRPQGTTRMRTAADTSGFILKGLRSLSHLPLIFEANEKFALNYSLVVKLVSLVAAAGALAVFFFYPPFFPVRNDLPLAMK